MERRRFTIAFKQQIIQEAKEVGNTARVARRHHLNPKMVYRWMEQAKHTDWQTTNTTAKAVKAYTPSPQEFRCLESENKQLKELLGEKDLEIAVLHDLLKKKNPAYLTRLKSLTNG